MRFSRWLLIGCMGLCSISGREFGLGVTTGAAAFMDVRCR